MNSPLTRRQQEILNFIRAAIAETGTPPTRAEIAAALGVRSPNAIQDHLHALEKKAAIELAPGSARGIRVLAETGLPVVGLVAAGAPILAEESIDRRLELDPNVFTPAADYFLTVRGESMIGAGILDGDLVAVHRAGEAYGKQIVVARIDDEVTIKRYHPTYGGIWLMPENEAVEPIWVGADNAERFVLEGVVVGVIRTAGP